MKPRVCAVSYLNTTPLVWGFLHGPQHGEVELRFEIPAVCAALLRAGEVDAGLVPSIELERQPIEIIPPLGIVSRGAVRSILLISKKPWSSVRTLAADESSRTSVVLAQILFAERCGVRLVVTPAFPDVLTMLQRADACLVIGDPALLVNSAPPDCEIYDLGAEWTDMTGLPMVYAVWAARAGFSWRELAVSLEDSYHFGRTRIDEIVAAEAPRRGVAENLARQYLTRNIAFELDAPALKGLAQFRALGRAHALV